MTGAAPPASTGPPASTSGARAAAGPRLLPRNDPRQYDDLADAWWDPAGSFAMLHWLAASRADLIPRATRDGSLLVDIACGGGLLAPHVARTGHRHVGVDIGYAAVVVAGEHGVHAVQGDALLLPLPDGCADVVVAGEVLEHVPDLPGVVAEVCRVLRPGGTVVLDTIAATRLGRLTAVTIGERIPGGPPRRLHDPDLFVDRTLLRRAFAERGVHLTLVGLRPPTIGYLRWLLARRRGRPVPALRMATTGLTGGLFQATGVSPAGAPRARAHAHAHATPSAATAPAAPTRTEET